MPDAVNASDPASEALAAGIWEQALIASSVDAIVATDLAGTIRVFNAGAEALYGYPAAKILGRPIAMLGWPSERDGTLEQVRSGVALAHAPAAQRRRDGSSVEVSVSASPIAGPDGRIIGMATIARNIEARVRQQEQLQFLADHDPLTGAGNRRRFERDLDDQLGRFRRHREDACLLMIDVDEFKAVNDDHGHGVGDEALRQIAGVLRERLRRSDSFARIGGDEFAVLLPYTTPAQAHVICEDLTRGIEALEIATAAADGVVTGISVSIGVAHLATHDSGDELLSAADKAMYDIKGAKAPKPAAVLKGATAPLPAAAGTPRDCRGTAPARS